jgi:hypothetical protein
VDSSNNNNYCRQNAGPEDVHPNDWREDQHLVPPVAIRPHRPAIVTPTSGNNRAVSINTPNHTPSDNTDDAVVTRRQMDRFAHLRPCLRKPCQWHEHCRQLHIPYGESENETNNNNNFPNENNCSGICSMPALPASNSQPNAKTHPGKIIPPEKKDKPTQTKRLLTHKKEEGNHTSIQGELASKEEERQVKNQKLIRGSQDRYPSSDGQHDEATRQKGQKRKEIKEPKNDTLDKARAILKFYKNR